VSERPGTVYRFFDSAGSLLYVGISVDLGGRLRSHSRIQPWWLEAATVKLAHFPDIEAARLEELRAIREERPRYNAADVPKPSRQLTLLPRSWTRPLPTVQEQKRESRALAESMALMHAEEFRERFKADGYCPDCWREFDSLSDFEKHLHRCLGVSARALSRSEKTEAAT